ncbi:MAG: acyl-CoA dehydrogenase family protein [Dehalococcoidia bacterium]
MDFSLTQEHEVLRQSMKEFGEGVIAPKVPEMEETSEMPLDVVAEMAKMDMLGVIIPRDLGGTGLGHLARMIMVEEIARISAAIGMCLQTLHIGAGAILTTGNDEQRQKYVPDLATGRRIAALSVTEPVGGSEPLAIQTTAKLEGDFYTISGRKCFIDNSHLADIHIITARTGEGPRDISAFILDNDTPGWRPGRLEHKMGLRGNQVGEVIVENCKVPKGNLIGAEGQGVRVALGGIGTYGRPGVAACALGILNGCLEAATKFAKERVLYGKPIAELQAIQWNICDIYLDLEISKLLIYRAAWMLDTGQRADAEIAAAKFYTTEAAVRSAKKAVDIHGAYGCMNEYAAQRYYRDAQLTISAGGTSEIQRMIMVRKPLS